MALNGVAGRAGSEGPIASPLSTAPAPRPSLAGTLERTMVPSQYLFWGTPIPLAASSYSHSSLLWQYLCSLLPLLLLSGSWAQLPAYPLYAMSREPLNPSRNMSVGSLEVKGHLLLEADPFLPI